MRYPSTRRRGMSLLEVLAATATLSLAAGVMALAVSFVVGAQRRDERILAAAEIANRLVLMFLDDRSGMPSESLPIPYGNDDFRFSIDDGTVQVTESPQVRDAKREAGRQSPIRTDRMRQLTVTVWLAEDSGGSRQFDAAVPSRTLIRLYDPLAVDRNPDSAEWLINREGGVESLMREVMGNLEGQP